MSIITKLSLVALLAILACGPAWSGLVAVQSQEIYTYDFDWSGCTLAEALEGLYTQFRVPTLAALLISDKLRAPQQFPMRTQPQCVPPALASLCDRDSTFLDRTTVFYPCELTALRWAMESAAARLAASLSSSQIKSVKEDGGVAFEELSSEQQEIIRFLAGARAFRGPQFPEPELTKRLKQSKVKLLLHLRVSFKLDSALSNGRKFSDSSSFPCESNASAKLWERWVPGQLEAHRLSATAKTSPGSDAPGDESVVELDRIYTVKDLIGRIEPEAEGTLNCDAELEKTSISAYCTMTTAALARACATATGTQWRKDGDNWLLTKGQMDLALANYGPKKSQEYMKACFAMKPALERLVRNGDISLLADEEWADLDPLSEVLTEQPVRWERLTANQQDYLRKKAKQHGDAYSYPVDLAAELPSLKMKWHPSLKLYVATEDAILFDEWLGYK
ncbi:MAG: hypothetical protein M1133_01875 [Armatimonadetes bacterium]|nr:hypothetical protein [Armatimonadota bacterium]